MLTVDDVRTAIRRDDLVPGYTDWIRQYARGEAIDVSAVNHAILDRWSPAALIYIKRLAWRTVFPK